MRKFGMAVVVLLLMVGVAFAANTITKKAGDYTVAVTIDKNPPITGKNNVDVSVKDSMGMVVTDAKVVVDIPCLPCPACLPRTTRRNAELKGETYKAVIEPSMSGPWNMAIKISRGGKDGDGEIYLGREVDSSGEDMPMNPSAAEGPGVSSLRLFLPVLFLISLATLGATVCGAMKPSTSTTSLPKA